MAIARHPMIAKAAPRRVLPPGEPYDRMVVATHEAGHSMLATALGLCLRGVKLGAAPRYDLAPIPAPCGAGDVRRRALILTLMAGGEAERLIYGASIGSSGDEAQIADLLTADDDEHALRNEVRRFLTANEGTLRYLAAKLARRGALTGADVAAVVWARRRA